MFRSSSSGAGGPSSVIGPPSVSSFKTFPSLTRLALMLGILEFWAERYELEFTCMNIVFIPSPREREDLDLLKVNQRPCTKSLNIKHNEDQIRWFQKTFKEDYFVSVQKGMWKINFPESAGFSSESNLSLYIIRLNSNALRV